MTSPAFSVRPLELAETYELRRRVLRNNDPGATVHIREDDSADAWHLGAVAPDGSVVATSSWYPVPCRVRPDAAHPWQLRFMAVGPEAQGRGVGGQIINAAVDRLGALGATLVWANARDTALAFYTGHGFEPVGASFVEPTTGLAHTVVVRELV